MSLNKSVLRPQTQVILRQLLRHQRKIPSAFYCTLRQKIPVRDVTSPSGAITNRRYYFATFENIRNKMTSADADKSQGEKAQGEKSGRRKMSTEWKIISSFALGALSWFMNTYFDRQHARKEVQLELINRQIRDLYGPLYGNRLVQETTYRAVVGEHSRLRTYLAKANELKDADMIRRWRSFVLEVMYPLDKEAERLICKNAHLIVNSDFPEEFERFLTHLAQMQFVMQHWKNEQGKLESTKAFTDDDFLERNNASGIRGIKQMAAHVEQKYKELRAKQKQLIIETSADDQSITSLLSKMYKR
uniref:Uncharacterized protein n=1 Tax=Ciona savignyi TaxID=51511 RepID=H2ZN64_CIOSA